jgi:type II secretory pathway pseudopilin PulG
VFSLLESIVATGVLAAALITLAYLMGISVATGATAKHLTLTTVFAAQKMEQLLTEQTLDAATDHAEYLASTGAIVCNGIPECTDLVYERRWSIAAMSGNPDAVLISVSVAHRRGAPRNALLVSVRARVRE